MGYPRSSHRRRNRGIVNFLRSLHGEVVLTMWPCAKLKHCNKSALLSCLPRICESISKENLGVCRNERFLPMLTLRGRWLHFVKEFPRFVLIDYSRQGPCACPGRVFVDSARGKTYIDDCTGCSMVDICASYRCPLRQLRRGRCVPSHKPPTSRTLPLPRWGGIRSFPS